MMTAINPNLYEDYEVGGKCIDSLKIKPQNTKQGQQLDTSECF